MIFILYARVHTLTISIRDFKITPDYLLHTRRCFKIFTISHASTLAPRFIDAAGLIEDAQKYNRDNIYYLNIWAIISAASPAQYAFRACLPRVRYNTDATRTHILMRWDENITSLRNFSLLED